MENFAPVGKTLTSLIWAIVQAWFIAGTLDITAATIHFLLRGGGNPQRLLQFIASAIMGKNAFSGGISTALLGLVLHYGIALVWTTLFFLLAAKIPMLVQNVAVSGVVYAIVVWCMMNFVVLPLSNIAKQPFNPLQSFIGVCILMLCIGLPIAYFARKYFV